MAIEIVYAEFITSVRSYISCKMESCNNNSTSKNVSMEPTEGSLNDGYIIGIYLTIVGLVASVANMTVLLVFWKRNSFRSPINFFILNLCVSDLMLAVITNPLSAAASFYERWPLQEVGCQLYGFISLTCFVNTTMTHAAISYYRYKIVCRREYLYNVQANSITKVLLGVWLITLFWTITPLAGWNSYTLEPSRISCYINQGSSDLKDKTYVCFYATFVLFLPLIFIVYFYGKIARHVKEMPWTKLRAVTFSSSFRNLMQIELKVTCVCVLMAALFMTTWITYVVVSLMQFFGVFVPDMLYLITMLLTKMSCTYNPFVYYFTNTKFRETLCSLIFRCHLKKIAPIHLEASGIEMRRNRVSPILTDDCQQSKSKSRYIIMAKTHSKHGPNNKNKFPEPKSVKVFSVNECFTNESFTFQSKRSIIPSPRNNRRKEDSANTFTEI